MALPNYSPSGTILFGSVPWSDDYANVRLYGSLDEQYSDIASLMVLRSDNYSYIGRDRRLKVSIEADRLYHCNYCMYRNETLTNGWIYCFVSDVSYVNDNTSELVLTTDIFQTYLHGTDWEIPPCFVERETSADDESFNPYVNEPSFSYTYIRNESSHDYFDAAGVVVMSAAVPSRGAIEEIEAIWNPDAYYADMVDPNIYFGVANGAVFNYYSLENVENNDEGNDFLSGLRHIVKGLNSAGSPDSIVSVFTVPSFALRDGAGNRLDESVYQDSISDFQDSFYAPARGDEVDGYAPRNRKLLCYPYNYLRLSDWQGSESELRYELLGAMDEEGRPQICIKYRPSPVCQAYAYPRNYDNGNGYYHGFSTNCGAQGSVPTSSFASWLAQNGTTVLVTAAGLALSAYTGGTSMAAASGTLRAANAAKAAGGKLSRVESKAVASAQKAYKEGAAEVTSAAMGAAQQAASLYGASKSPVTTRGKLDYSEAFMTGAQGVHAERMSIVSEQARQIDYFFDMFGYAVEEVKQVEIASRPAWNYVKTGGAVARSTNVAAGASAPFSRGRGTPSSVLTAISAAFDGGITFWHTTSGFGDYSQDNSV